MSFLKKFFGTKDEPIKSYDDFWAWFVKNEAAFFTIVKTRKDIEKQFFDKLSPKIDELKDGYFFVTGMYNDNTAELVITADGNTKNIVFVEELVSSAPKIDRWKFTALKPALDLEDVNISMSGHEFNGTNLFFYSNDNPAYPDEVDISIIHHDLTDENRKQISTGVYVFLDNYLGELDFANNIDSISIVGTQEAEKEPIPISKLKDFLNWRQKEFVEKYEAVRYNTENDNYSMLEAELESGNKLFAVINTELLEWDSRASHPWMAIVTLKYDGINNNGMPSDEDYELLNKIEEEIALDLKDIDGYLNVGRQTANGEREIYFACKDFRKPSKVFYKVQQSYSANFEIEYDIYKDKYWQLFERFMEK
ncbi:DUF695 domain-containing protein [Lacibacter sp. H407]|uniref:DUF695 domain-containing protein n=1 Tax=Lacibacter sp. H407 TaxID=3133423 RepID=UPI0030C476BA